MRPVRSYALPARRSQNQRSIGVDASRPPTVWITDTDAGRISRLAKYRPVGIVPSNHRLAAKRETQVAVRCVDTTVAPIPGIEGLQKSIQTVALAHRRCEMKYLFLNLISSTQGRGHRQRAWFT